MADIKIKRTSVGGDYSTETYFEANGYDYLNEDLIKTLFGSGAAVAMSHRTTMAWKILLKMLG